MKAVFGSGLLVQWLLASAFLVYAGEPVAPQIANVPIGKVRSFTLNEYSRYYDGQWLGNKVASDGNCYFGSSSHSAHHGAGFFRYEPDSGKLRTLCEDITRACGEDPATQTPQGKLHSDIVEANGWLYFATHIGNEQPALEKAYTGAHIIGYELGTGRFRDLGVVKQNYTIYSGLSVDPKRGRLFVLVNAIDVYGSHLYRVDIASGKKEDLGLVTMGGLDDTAGFYQFVDSRGDCWFSVKNGNAALFRVGADADRLERFENALPPMRAWNKDEIVRQPGRWWHWAQALPDGERCAFTLMGQPYRNSGGELWIFDPRKGLKDAFRGVRHIGPTDLGLAVAADRVYYVQYANRQLNRGDLHLLSVSLDPKRFGSIFDHGEIVDQEGRKPMRIPSLSADTHGRVYMVGDWYLKPGEKGSIRNNREVNRGQFFAVADVSGGAR